MTNKFEEKVKRHYQSLPEPKLTSQKQDQLWENISEQLDHPSKRFKLTFPYKIIAGLAAVALALIIFVPSIMHSAGYTLGSNLNQAIKHSPLMKVKKVIFIASAKGGALVFYRPNIAGKSHAQSELAVRYIEKTFWGGWHVTSDGGAYSSGVKQQMYTDYIPKSKLKPFLYGEVVNPKIKRLELFNQKNQKQQGLTMVFQPNSKGVQSFIWYAYIDASKGPNFKIVGTTIAGKQLAAMQYNIKSNSESKTKPIFDKYAALKKVIGKHPEFPDIPNKTVKKNVNIGGGSGRKLIVDLTTSVAPKDTNLFIVTFTKNWHISFNGTDVKSIYQYAVTPTKVQVLKDQNRDQLASSIK